MLSSSYRQEEVTFLLTDLSGHALELGLRERAGLQRPRLGQLIPPKATAATPELSR